jgi:hypothetical protein
LIVLRPHLVGLALALVAGTALIAPMVPATAASGFVGIKCTSLTTFHLPPLPGWSPAADFPGLILSRCDGNTGGAGSFTFSQTSSQIITWSNGKTTELSPAKVSTTEYDPDPRGTCNRRQTEFKATGVVEADTTGSAPVLGKYTYEVCSYGDFVNEPGSGVKIG